MGQFDIGRTTGLLFLIVLLTSAISGAFWSTPLEPADTANALNAIASGPALFRASIIVDLISNVCIIALAGALFLSFNSYSKSFAVFGTLWRAVEGIILVLTETVNSVLLIVAQDYVTATGTEAVALESLGKTLLILEQWSYAVGMTFFALGSLMFAILFVTRNAISLKIGRLGVVASLLAVAQTWLGLAIPEFLIGTSTNPVLLIFFLPIIIYEIILGIWLLRGGLQSKRSP